MNGLNLIIFILLLVDSGRVWSQNHLDLSISQTKVIDLPHYPVVEISRKGFIEVNYHAENHNWQLTALRRGFIIISFFKFASDREPVHKIYVKISSEPNATAQRWLVLCRKIGGQCDDKAKIVSGLIDDSVAFHHLQLLCSKRETCLFKAQMTIGARERTTKRLRQTFPKDSVSIKTTKNGHIIMKIHCSNWDNKKRQMQEKLNTMKELKKWINAPYLHVECEKRSKRANYRLSGKVLLVTLSASESRGITGTWSLKVDGALRHNPTIAALLQSVDGNHRIDVLAEPSLLLLAGQKAKLHSGGELAWSGYSTQQERTTIAWKESGIKLEAVVTPNFDDYVVVDYQLQLRYRHGRDRLALHNLAGQVLLQMGQSTIVGRAQLDQDREDKINMFPANIPIIGPLFSGHDHADSSAQVVFTLMINNGSV